MTAFDDTQLSFGLYLQSCRKMKDLSLNAIAHELKIGPSVLRAIENEDLSKFPDEVFAKGFLRGFARTVNADEGRVISGYLQRLHQLNGSDQGIHYPVHENRTPRRKTALLAGFAIIAVLLAIFIFSGKKNDAQKKQTVETVATTEPAPAAEEASPQTQEDLTDSKNETESAPPAETDSKKIRLSIVTIAETWLKIIIDNGQAKEYMLRPGDHLDLEASTRYNLLIGNAAGIKISANAVPVDIPGGKGKVVHLEIP